MDLRSALPEKPSFAGRSVLIGWEAGGGLGHVRPLLRLARALAACGHSPVLAVRDLVGPWSALQGASFPVVPAPVWPAHRAREEGRFLAASYADILAVRGYDSADDLLALVRGWQGLIDLVRPDLVICNHSPTLCLAAYGVLPTVLLGNPFSMPPADGPTFPLLLPGKQVLVPEEKLMGVVREVQHRRGRPTPATLPGLFAGAERFVTAWPELDPYRAVRHEPYAGPLDPLPQTPLPPATLPGFFAYLDAETPGLEHILANLARTGYPGTAYLRGAGQALRDRLRRPGLEVLDRPATLAEVLPRAAVVVHHGGATLAQQALAAGRRQLVLPTHLEQILNGQLLDQLGVGEYLLGKFTGEDVAQVLRRLLTGPRFAAQAQAAAEVIWARGVCDPLPTILDRCQAMLASQPTLRGRE